MDSVTANLHLQHKMNPAAHNCWLAGFPTVLRFAPSRSDVVCSLAGINPVFLSGPAGWLSAKKMLAGCQENACSPATKNSPPAAKRSLQPGLVLRMQIRCPAPKKCRPAAKDSLQARPEKPACLVWRENPFITNTATQFGREPSDGGYKEIQIC